MSSGPIEVWFEFASTYSYIAAQTVEDRCSPHGISIVWRPFLLGPVFQKYGWNDSPFNLQKAKGAYMWRDLERECVRLNLPFICPSQFPRNGMTAARIATAAEQENWVSEFIRKTFLANFFYDRNIADRKVLSDILEQSGCSNTPAALATADDPEVKDKLRQRTQEAMDRGIFGAPSFFVQDELFWGADRLDQAIEYAKQK